jgi:hypothetical protein
MIFSGKAGTAGFAGPGHDLPELLLTFLWILYSQ